MAYNTKAIKTDKDGNPISQYYNPNTDEYEPVEGAGGGNAVILYNEDGTPNNSLNFGEILDKLDQLTGTVIDEETRQQNEQLRQQAENERIQAENERIQVENVRQSNENIRESNEQTRQQNEQLRQQAENERIQAENERIQAENTRIQNENERKSNEQIRQQKEDERQQNEITRQTNEQTRQQNEQQRIDLYNTLKDLDVSQYELRLQKLEHDTSVEEFILEEAHGTVISMPENVINGQISEVKIEGFTLTNVLGDTGDFESSATWSKTGEINISSNRSKYGNNSARANPNNNVAYYYKDILLDPSKYYIAIAECYIESYNQGSIAIRKSDYGSFSTGASGASFDTTKLNQWQARVLKFNNISGIRLLLGCPTASTLDAYIDGVRLYEVSEDDYNLSEDELIAKYHYINSTKSTISAIRIKSVNEDESKESTLYVIAKDEEGNILELRSLPNGVKDEIDVSGRKLIKRTKKIIFDGSENWTTVFDAGNTYRTRIANWSLDNNAVLANSNAFYVYSESTNFTKRNDATSDPVDVNSLSLGTSTFPNLYIWLEKSLIDNQPGDTTLDKIKSYLNANPVTLIYQLVEPIEMPVEVFGNLQSYENGTIYVETIIPRVDFYTPEGIELEGPPEKEPRIKEIDSLYLVDRENGLLIPLDISKAIIEDIALRHPDLVGGALVVWDYIPDVESTNPVISMVLPTNLKASTNSSLSGIRDLSEKIGNLNIRVTAIQKDDISQLNEKILEVEDNLNRHVDDFDNHIEECAIWKRIDTLSAPVQLTTDSTFDNPIIVPVNETPASSNVYAVEFRIQTSDERASQITIFAGGTSSVTGIFCGVDHAGDIYAARRSTDAANKQFKFFTLVSPTGGTREVYISKIFRVK